MSSLLIPPTLHSQRTGATVVVSKCIHAQMIGQLRELFSLASHWRSWQPSVMRRNVSLRIKLQLNYWLLLANTEGGTMAFLRRITPNIKKRITRAQSVQVDLTKACSTDLLKTVEGHAKAVGAP